MASMKVRGYHGFRPERLLSPPLPALPGRRRGASSRYMGTSLDAKPCTCTVCLSATWGHTVADWIVYSAVLTHGLCQRACALLFSNGLMPLVISSTADACLPWSPVSLRHFCVRSRGRLTRRPSRAANLSRVSVNGPATAGEREGR